MAKSGDKHTAYGLLAGALGVMAALSAAALIANRQAPGQFHPFRGWALFFIAVIAVCVLTMAWIVAGIFTPLWDVPDLPRGESHFHRLRTRSARRAAASDLRRAMLSDRSGNLKVNQGVLERALVEGKVWPDYPHGPRAARTVDYARLLDGAGGTAREFLLRCQVSDHALEKASNLAYGDALSSHSEGLIRDALSEIGSALTAADAATEAVGE